MRWVLGLLLLTGTLAGCIGDDDELDAASLATSDFLHLSADEATEILDEAGVRTFVFEGMVPERPAPPLSVPFVGGAIDRTILETPFEVDATVGYVELVVSFDEDEGDIMGFLLDEEERTQCGANTIGAPKSCTTTVTDAAGPAGWTLRLAPGFGAAPSGMAYRAEVSLHPIEHLLAQLGDPLAGVDTNITFRVSDTGVIGAEPNIGLLSDGTIFVQEFFDTMRSSDDGATWEDVAPPYMKINTFDPMLRTDPFTDIVYTNHLQPNCTHQAWSEDGGNTWLFNPAACGTGGEDHQKLAVGPHPLGLPTNVVYLAYQARGAAWVSRSLDGGVTWTPAEVTSRGAGDPYRNTGPVEADRDGTVFVPYYLCDGAIGVGLSTDFGASFWFDRVVPDEAITCEGTHRTDPDPGPAFDMAGNLYVAYRTDHGLRYIFSTDKGTTWSEPIDVAPEGLRSITHVDAVAGDDGRLAIAYRGTADSDKGPNSDGFAAWHMYVTFIEGATSGAPIVRTAMINDPSDPVQRGPICSMGSACAGGSRNLLDFIDIAVGPDGRVYVAYADGCDGSCATPGDSRERLGLVGILEDGPRLFETAAPWA